MRYLSRVADKMLQERLETFGAVLIEGPNGQVKQLLQNNRPEA